MRLPDFFSPRQSEECVIIEPRGGRKHDARSDNRRGECELSVIDDNTNTRPIQRRSNRKVIAIPQVGGPHRRYQRLAA